MKILRTMITALVAAAGAAGPLWAGDIALVLTNRIYADGQETAALRFDQISRQLRDAGFQVIGGDNLVARVMAARAAEFRDALADDAELERALIVLSGRVVAGQGDSWFLGREAGEVSDLTAAQRGLSLAVLDDLLADYPGQSLMAVAPAWRSRRAPGQGLRVGLGGHQPGQGVTLMSGYGADVQAALREVLQGAEPLADAAARAPHGVNLRGYLPRNRGFSASEPDPVDNSDSAYWSAVRDINTAAGYQAYLRRFPNGLFVTEAQRLLQGVQDTPQQQAAAEEKALNLSRNDRRSVQRDLTLLGFDTRGVDGVFGPGTRGAIRAFQRSRGFRDTGYLTRAMVTRLVRDADARRKEVEAEDRAYWQRTGITGVKEDLEAYLERYPNGVFSEDARDQLAVILAEEAEVAFREAQQLDTVAAYQDFLRRYPNGPLAEQARSRIDILQNTGTGQTATDTQIAKDKAEERVVASNPVARLLIERALEKVGHNPGPVDGRFDQRSRRAIKAFQRSAKLPRTGYVSRDTMARLTAASLR